MEAALACQSAPRHRCLDAEGRLAPILPRANFGHPEQSRFRASIRPFSPAAFPGGD